MDDETHNGTVPDNVARSRHYAEIGRATQFKPGQSGNPKGRTPRKALSERFADLLDAKTLDGIKVKKGEDVADTLARAFVVAACKGKFPYAKEVIDRLEGKVPDRIAGPDGGDVIVKVVKVVSFEDL